MKNLLPTARFDGISDIPDGFLSGFKLVVLDMDNTVSPWHTDTVSESTFKWVKKVIQSGVQVVLFTNSKGTNADSIGVKLGIPVFKNAKKPFKKQAEILLKNFDANPERTLFVGDQLFTDISLANKLGAKSVLTKPLSSREWWCTKVFNRSRERIVYPFLFKK